MTAIKTLIERRAVLIYHLSEPLDNAKSAKVDIKTGDGNLTLDRLISDEPVLVKGVLEYLEKQGPPILTRYAINGEAEFILRSGEAGRPWFRFPWAVCNGATEWQIHLNANVHFDITAHSGGGNVKLDLAGMMVTRVMADSGAGNVDVLLPDHAANLNVTAKTGAGNVAVEIGSDITGSSNIHAHSGAGNVIVRIPTGVAAKIYASSGLGKLNIEPRFGKSDSHTYQSPDYDGAANKIEITIDSGAGNVSIITK